MNNFQPIMQFTGMKRTASVRSNGGPKSIARTRQRYPYYVMCVDNNGYEGSLLLGKVYRVLKPESKVSPSSWLRVVDEEGEDYLYPPKRFVRVELSDKAKKAVIAGSMPAGAA